MIRLFIPDANPRFAEGVSVPLDPDQGRYLTSVMRKGPGDVVSVFNGRDGEWTALLAEAGKRHVTLRLLTQTRPQPTAMGPVLAVALIKRSPLEYIIEKATELGAAGIQLLITRRTQSDHVRLDRLTAIAREAAEQTERLDVPVVMPPVRLDVFLQGGGFDQLFFADEESSHEAADGPTPPLMRALSSVQGGGRHVILIGPEGGFDEEERATLRALPGCCPVNLGPRILRADTAAISALTLYQAMVGDW